MISVVMSAGVKEFEHLFEINGLPLVQLADYTLILFLNLTAMSYTDVEKNNTLYHWPLWVQAVWPQFRACKYGMRCHRMP